MESARESYCVFVESRHTACTEHLVGHVGEAPLVGGSVDGRHVLG
jgi:hypothetical protein